MSKYETQPPSWNVSKSSDPLSAAMNYADRHEKLRDGYTLLVTLRDGRKYHGGAFSPATGVAMMQVHPGFSNNSTEIKLLFIDINEITTVEIED